jgi:Xaa-Pro aminopeptidase
MDHDLYPASRLAAAAKAAEAAGLDVLLLTPGPDLRYVTGYDAVQLERLTCLVLPTSGEPFLVVPRLELPAAQASPAGALGIEFVPWEETEDPFALVAARLGGAGVAGLSDRMWALNVFRFRDALPSTRQRLASEALSPLRIRKSEAEVAALREAGAAIDRVHARVPGFLRPGVTEREAGAQIAEAILAEGHATVDFVIVASGPNGASPHHEVSDRVLSAGDAVVVDIGGTMPSGYCSDCTRMYSLGAPPEDFLAYFAVLRSAQDASCSAVRPGVSAESVDRAARSVIEDGGYGELFIHRTGHGIGLETHEDPYIVAGNETPLEAGMAFSVEPGIYPGPHGARIEDIVVCTADGVERLNNAPRDLVVVLQVGTVGPALAIGEKLLELGRDLVGGGHLLAVGEQALGLVGLGRVVLLLEGLDQLGDLGRLLHLASDEHVGAVGGLAEAVVGQIETGRLDDRFLQGERAPRVDGLRQVVRHLYREPDRVQARLAEAKLDQR